MAGPPPGRAMVKRAVEPDRIILSSPSLHQEPLTGGYDGLMTTRALAAMAESSEKAGTRDSVLGQLGYQSVLVVLV